MLEPLTRKEKQRLDKAELEESIVDAIISICRQFSSTGIQPRHFERQYHNYLQYTAELFELSDVSLLKLRYALMRYEDTGKRSQKYQDKIFDQMLKNQETQDD